MYQKTPLKKYEDNPQSEEYILFNISEKTLLYRTYKELLPINKKNIDIPKIL